MSVDLATCPFCNASAPAASVGQRVACLRCGETFVARGGATISAPPETPPSEPVLPPPRRSNVQVAAFVLGGMALFALIGALYALGTVETRRDHDVVLPKSRAVAIPVYLRALLGVFVVGLTAALVWGWNRGERDRPRPLADRLRVAGLALVSLLLFGAALVLLQGRPARPTKSVDDLAAPRAIPPSQLPALGYLPEGTNAIVAVHAAEARQTSAGRAALGRFRAAGVGADGFEAWTGIKLDDMDHAALGLVLDEQILPRRTVVVRTLRPYDLDKVRDRLEARRSVTRGGRTLYLFRLERLGVEASLWAADERTLVVAGKPDDFDRIPSTPRDGLGHLPPEVASYLTERIGPSAQAWAAGHVAAWNKVGAQLFLAGLFGKAWAAVSGVRTFGASLLCDDAVRFEAALRCADDAKAEALEKALRGAEIAPLFNQGNEADPLFQSLGKTTTIARDGVWVVVQAKGTTKETTENTENTEKKAN